MGKQEKRSLSNLVLTKKYHRLYMEKMVLISLAPIALVYALLLSHLLSQTWPDPPEWASVGLLFLLCVVLASAVWAAAVLTAHRIAGPNIKMIKVCRAIAEGDTEMTLKFRADDRLEELEEAFNTMVAALRKDASPPQAESEPSPTENPAP